MNRIPSYLGTWNNSVHGNRGLRVTDEKHDMHSGCETVTLVLEHGEFTVHLRERKTGARFDFQMVTDDPGKGD